MLSGDAEVWPKWSVPYNQGAKSACGKEMAYCRQDSETNGETFHVDGTSFKWCEDVPYGWIPCTEAEAKKDRTLLSGDIVYGHPNMPRSRGDLEEFLCDAIEASLLPSRDSRLSNGQIADTLFHFLDVAVVTPEQQSRLRKFLDESDDGLSILRLLT